jgi:hypothetical protein
MEELQKAIEELIADRDRWRSIAERAIHELETAVKLIENVGSPVRD